MTLPHDEMNILPRLRGEKVMEDEVYEDSPRAKVLKRVRRCEIEKSALLLQAALQISAESTKKRHAYDLDGHRPEHGEETKQRLAVDGEALTRAYKTVEEFVGRVDALNADLTKDAVTILQVQNGRGRDCDVVCAKLQALLQEGIQNAQVYQSRIEKLREVKEELRQEYLSELDTSTAPTTPASSRRRSVHTRSGVK